MSASPRRQVAIFDVEVLGRATLSVRAMSLQTKQVLADAIHAEQPNLLYSVLALQRFGASLPQIEVVLDFLFVVYTAMKATGRRWGPITEDLQETCLRRFKGRLRFSEGLAPAQHSTVVQQFIDDHPEPALLALAYGLLRDAGWSGVTDDAQKYLVLAALNLVECVSQAAERTAC